MDGIDEPEGRAAVNYALALLNTVQGANSLGFTPFNMSDFTLYEFELMTYLQAQLARTRPKPKLT